MRLFKPEDVIGLYLEYSEDIGDSLLQFYSWANKECGPIIPEDRNKNPYQWVKEIINESNI